VKTTHLTVQGRVVATGWTKCGGHGHANPTFARGFPETDEFTATVGGRSHASWQNAENEANLLLPFDGCKI